MTGDKAVLRWIVDEASYLASGFRRVDAANRDRMLACLDFLHSLPCFRAYKERSFDLLSAAEAGSVVDIACGQGDDVIRLKQRFGRAVGVDASHELIEEARKRHREHGCEFVLADAAQLPFGDGEFSAARVDRSLQHMEAPDRVVREMARVVRSGGSLVCAEPDWGTFFLSAPMSKMTREIQERFAQSFRNPWIGRNLPSLLKGYVERVQVEAYTLLTTDFTASDNVFDVCNTVRLLQEEKKVELSGWIEEFREFGAVAGVTLVLCSGTTRRTI
ncbi:MAG TPA: methyltransferase domain-containing protein [Terrimicrobiaceae bacterium]